MFFRLFNWVQHFFVQNLLDSDAKTDSDLAGFDDKYQTSQQKIRDYEITKLLKKYVEAYSEKVYNRKRYRNALFILSAAILIVFSAALLVFLYNCVKDFNLIEIPGVITIISLCITFLTSILGLFTIITKFCFPENDEEYITKIVEAIQKNDLENKKENMKISDQTNKESKQEHC